MAGATAPSSSPASPQEDDEYDKISYVVNNMAVTVKRGLHAKTILAQLCHKHKLVYPTFQDSLSNPDATGEWRLFKSRFELAGKKVVGSGISRKDAEQAAARNYINNVFLPMVNSPQAEIPVPNLKKNPTPCQRRKEMRRMQKHIEKKRQEAADDAVAAMAATAVAGSAADDAVAAMAATAVAGSAADDAVAAMAATAVAGSAAGHVQATEERSEEVLLDGAIGGIGLHTSSFIFVDLERACGNLDSEIIQLGYCSAMDEGLVNVFPKGKIDPGGSFMSHKIVAAPGNKLRRKGKTLPSGDLREAADKFISFLKRFASINGKKPVLCCHGDDMETLFNNFASLGLDQELGNIIEGSIDFLDVLVDNETFPYPESSSMSLTRLDPKKPNLPQTILKEDFDVKMLTEAHNALCDSRVLMDVVQRYCKDFLPEPIMIDSFLVPSDRLIKVVEHHVRVTRMKRKPKSRLIEQNRGFITFNGWDQYLMSGENLPRQR